ncbi:ATP-binding protein [Streptomyces sp. NPDC091265]|uniref:ATP-binding protein n=1 Tax=unclassified Streptomyces TaxID=2593676 RepID=UPI00344EDD63
MTDNSVAPDSGVTPGAAPANTPPGARPALPATAAEARSRVEALVITRFRELKAVEVDEVRLADVLLVTSELVTNAIRHGGGLTGFAAALTDDGLLLDVADASTQLPVVTDPADRGRGLVGGFGWPLICRLARHVAVTPRPDGKQITALLPLV